MAEQAGYGRRAAPDLERAKVAPWFQNPIQRIWTLIFPILNKPPTCHCHLPVQTPQCQLGFRMTLRGGKERQIALTRTEGQASARHPPPPAVPARSTVQRLTRGVARAVARGQPEARARARKGREGGEPRASRWARLLARVRAPRLFPHVPRAARPLPAGSARLPPSRRGSLGFSEPHTPRRFCHSSLLGPGSLARRHSLGLSASQASSPPSATPRPFPSVLSHPVHRESLDTKQAGLRGS